MGKMIPRSACSFTPTTGASAGLNYGPQVLNSEPWQAILLGAGGSACSVRLGFAGTYLLLGRIHFGGNFQAGDEVTYGMMDMEQELEIGDTALLKAPLANGEWEQEFTRIHTINSPRTVFLYASNNAGDRGGVIGLRTGIQWVRLN
jgi:hypothetical protein